jgi:alginate O-acetyltransferase complex protein AlgJ
MVVIYAPLVGSFFKAGVTSDEVILSSELRQPAKLPEVNSLLKKRNPFEYIRDLEQYYKDKFGFRKNMIQSYSIAKVFWLGESSSSNVILGKKGWFFLSKAGNQNELNYYRGINPFTQKELAQWKFVLEKRKNWLDSQGIRYLLVIAPNKTTIYPEFLPKSINYVTKESRLDRLLSYMKQNSNVEILDLRSSLLAAKEKGNCSTRGRLTKIGKTIK